MPTAIAHVGKFLRFCIAGAAGVAAYYMTLYGLTEFFEVWYIFSAMIGFILNTGLNFISHKFWVFKSKEAIKAKRQLTLFFIMSISFFTGNAVALYVLVEYLHLWYIHAQVIITIIASIASFILSGKIFKQSSE